MKKITKEMCMVYVKDYYKSNAIVLFILSIFAVVGVGFFTKNVIIAAIVAALTLLAILFIPYFKSLIEIYPKNKPCEAELIEGIKRIMKSNS